MGPLSSSSSSSTHQNLVIHHNENNNNNNNTLPLNDVDELLRICQERVNTTLARFPNTIPLNKTLKKLPLYEVVQISYDQVEKSDISEDDVQLLEETLRVENYYKQIQDWNLICQNTQNTLKHNTDSRTLEKVKHLVSKGSAQADQCMKLYDKILGLKYNKVKTVKKETNLNKQNLLRSLFDVEILKLREQLSIVEREKDLVTTTLLNISNSSSRPFLTQVKL